MKLFPYAASRNFQITCMSSIDNKKEFSLLKITVVKNDEENERKSSIVYEINKKHE